MSDEQNPESSTEPNPASNPPRRKLRRRWLFAGGLGFAALAGLASARAWAHGHRHGFGRAQSADELRARLDRAAEFALARVQASDVQRERVDAVLDRAAPGLFALHQRGFGLRQELLDALARADRTAVEDTRKRALHWADDASRQWLSAIEQSLAELDAGQREALREQLARFGAHRAKRSR